MIEIGIDIETYSSISLVESGVYRYAEAPDFRILLFAYCVDGGPVKCVDIESGEQLPQEILVALRDPSVVKTAYNAAFERICIGAHFGWGTLDPSQWQCTMVRAARMGLPMSLGACGEILNLAEGKMKEGAALIRYFSCPTKGKRHLPSDAPERWETFKAYCIRDVEVEQQILQRVRRIEVPPEEDRLYALDQRINDRGVLLDIRLASNAGRLDDEYKRQLMEEARQITGLDNPNSPAQIKEWLNRTCGVNVNSLCKGNLDKVEDMVRYQPKAKRLLEIRRELGKTSTAKYRAMLDCVCSDGRMHGLLQFYGASRTGRWAGRLVQLQNLPQNHIPDLDRARNLVLQGDLEELLLYYDNPTHTLSELIRTALIAPEGHVFHVCDFSAIEARVIAWLAGEQWVLDVFRQGGDVYCATASQMFSVPVEKHGANAQLRQKGKIAVLALGYGGGVAALEAMGGSRMGLSEQEERDIMMRWRKANPHIVRLWRILEDAAIAAIRTGREVVVHKGIIISFRWGCLLIRLPSGRYLCYPRARVGTEYNDGFRGDHDIIEYEGLNQTTKQWMAMRTYGGKLTENVVQAIARDILGAVLLRAEDKGMCTVFHVHDEIVVEAPEGSSLAEVEQIFSYPMDWCKGLPLIGAGYTTKFYKKD